MKRLRRYIYRRDISHDDIKQKKRLSWKSFDPLFLLDPGIVSNIYFFVFVNKNLSCGRSDRVNKQPRCDFEGIGGRGKTKEKIAISLQVHILLGSVRDEFIRVPKKTRTLYLELDEKVPLLKPIAVVVIRYKNYFFSSTELQDLTWDSRHWFFFRFCCHPILKIDFFKVS